MTPISKKTVTPTGETRIHMTLDPFAFVFNSFAMGDVIATVPVVKHAIDTHFPDPSWYRVVAKQAFRPLFPFVPDECFIDFDDTSQPNWGIPNNFAMGVINKKSEGRIIRMTPKKMLLGQYGSCVMTGELLEREHLNYVPLDPVDISHFGTDFSKAVILVTTYRDYTRSWKPEYIMATAEWIKNKGYLPVFVGKTGMDENVKESVRPKNALPDDVSHSGLDLRNKTSIAELASIMGQSAAVCGVDCGPVHLAGTTSVPIVCGYTSVASEYRIPIRPVGKTYAITPNLSCINCESRWHSSFHNYENCYVKNAYCVDMLTDKRFCEILDTFL